MLTSIDILEQEIWNLCIIRTAPKDLETENRWATNETAYLREGFIIKQIPEHIHQLVIKAVLYWEDLEKNLLDRLLISRADYLRNFSEARTCYLNGSQEWEDFIFSTESAVRGVVRNMDWVNLFSWILPIADLENSEHHRLNGQMVATVFYSELLSKYGHNPNLVSNNPLGKIETRWRMANNID